MSIRAIRVPKSEQSQRRYERSNHLGNVLATVLDRKTTAAATGTIIAATAGTNHSGIFRADIATATDYYAFGQPMPTRDYKATWSSTEYRYGMNTQEESPEIQAFHTTALYWEYDSRIGRRWNVDPVVKEWESPYMCFGDNPIMYTDKGGDDPISAIGDAILAFGLELGLEIGVKMLEGESFNSILGEIRSQGLSNPSIRNALFEGGKTFAIAIFLPPGGATALKIQKMTSSKAGKIMYEVVSAFASEMTKMSFAGEFKDKTTKEFSLSLMWDKAPDIFIAVATDLGLGKLSDKLGEAIPSKEAMAAEVEAAKKEVGKAKRYAAEKPRSTNRAAKVAKLERNLDKTLNKSDVVKAKRWATKAVSSEVNKRGVEEGAKNVSQKITE